MRDWCAILTFAILIAASAPAHGAKQNDEASCKYAKGSTRIAACTRAIESKKFDRDPARLSELYLQRAFEFDNSDTERALSDYDQAIRLNSNNAYAYSGRAIRLKHQGELDRAIADWTAFIQLKPNSGWAYMLRSEIWLRKSDYDRAIEDSSRAIKLWPGNASDLERRLAIEMRGWANLYSKRIDFALADFNDALEQNPKSAYAIRGRARVFEVKDELDRAINDYNEIIRLDPESVEIYVERALLHGRMGNMSAANSDIETALRLDAKSSFAYSARGTLHLLQRDLDHALADFEQALALNSKSTAALRGRGTVRWRRGETEAAVVDFNEALRLGPQDPESWALRGEFWEAQGDIKKARADYETAAAKRTASLSERVAVNLARRRLVSLNNVTGPSAASQHQIAPKAASASVSATAERRVALVIGNAAYASFAELTNPRRDAEAMATIFRKIGFETVIAEQDTSREKMVTALRRFADEADKADWAVIYYAGHGIEVNGVNYILPVDASLKSDRDVQDEAVPLERLIATIEGAKKLRLVILDACRDNPFVPKMRRTIASRSIGRGLASVEPEGGTLVAYAAKHGQVALDGGDGANSPFVEALLQRLTIPNVEISKVFRLVRDDVLNSTGRRQEPFVYGSLPSDDFYFVQNVQ